MRDSSTQPSSHGHCFGGGRRLGTWSSSGSQSGYPSGEAATTLLGSLLCGLIKCPLGLNCNLSQGSDQCPIHFQLLINPGKAQDKRLHSPSLQGHFHDWGALSRPAPNLLTLGGD